LVWSTLTKSLPVCACHEHCGVEAGRGADAGAEGVDAALGAALAGCAVFEGTKEGEGREEAARKVEDTPLSSRTAEDLRWKGNCDWERSAGASEETLAAG
jgi:hypothetical protein